MSNVLNPDRADFGGCERQKSQRLALALTVTSRHPSNIRPFVSNIVWHDCVTEWIFSLCLSCPVSIESVPIHMRSLVNQRSPLLGAPMCTSELLSLRRGNELDPLLDCCLVNSGHYSSYCFLVLVAFPFPLWCSWFITSQ